MPTIQEAVGLLQLNDGLEFVAATEMLFKIIQNIIKDPDEPKYRTLKRSGTAFQKAVGSAKGGARFLKACGFVEAGEGDEATLALPANAPKGLLEEGKAALKAAVKLHAAQRDEARRRENEASAEKLALLKAVSRKNTASRDQEAERERQRLREGLVIDKQENDSWKQEYDVKQTLHRVATFTCRGPHGPILLHPSFRYRRR
jgi:hypothetical protein